MGEILFWEESRFGRNIVSRGIPFRKESCYGRNLVLGGIPFRKESCFWRNPISEGIPFRKESFVWRNPDWDKFQAGGVSWKNPDGRSLLGGILLGRSSTGSINVYFRRVEDLNLSLEEAADSNSVQVEYCMSKKS